MFKEENRVWWYILGVLALIALFLYVGYVYIFPAMRGERRLFPLDNFVYDTAPGFDIDVNRNYLVRFVTNKGTFVVDLYEKNAPENVNNFIFLARNGFYSGTKFHRLIPGLLLQGGDRNSLDEDKSNDGRGGSGYLIADEVNWDSLGLSEARRQQLTSRGYKSNAGVSSRPLSRFALAMANSAPNTNSSQFFFVLAPTNDARLAEMQGQFTVIGGAIENTIVLDTLGNTAVDNPADNVPHPISDLIIERLEIISR